MKRYYIAVLSIVFFFSSLTQGVATEIFTGDSNRLTGESTTIFYSEKKDSVNIAFKKIDANNVVGVVGTLNADRINEDDNTVWASGVFAGRALGMLGNTNIRGIGISIDVADLTGSGTLSGNALFVVDGLPRDVEGLRLSLASGMLF